MKIFLDSADLDEIKQCYEWGIVDGITTNPSLLKKAVDKRKGPGESLDIKTYIIEILNVARNTPVSLEVTETTAAGMIKEAVKLYSLFSDYCLNLNIKIPVNPAFSETDKTQFDGIIAIKELYNKNITVNATLIFTPEQALLAAKAGAAYVSPFAGRIDDYIRSKNKIDFNKSDYFPAEGFSFLGEPLDDNGIVSGIDLVKKCVDIVQRHNLETKVIAASLRNPRQVREAALVGAHIATVPYNTLKDMLKHEKTYEGMKKFTADIIQEYANLK